MALVGSGVMSIITSYCRLLENWILSLFGIGIDTAEVDDLQFPVIENKTITNEKENMSALQHKKYFSRKMRIK